MQRHASAEVRMSFQPSQARAKYKSITVLLDAPTAAVPVAVTRYACSVYGRGQEERRQFRERLHRASAADQLGLTEHEFVDVFTGKGMPDAIAKCLRLAARHRVYCHAGPGAGAGAGLDAAAGIRQVADSYVGLDCNGFVGNWARMAGVRHATAQRAPLDWLSHTRVRRRLEDVSPFDVLVWANGCHIAVLENCDAPTASARRRHAEVAESSTGGIQLHPYVIRTVSTPTTVTRDHHTYSTSFVIDCRIHGTGVPVFIGRLVGLV
jgi:hypothetical protein